MSDDNNDELDNVANAPSSVLIAALTLSRTSDKSSTLARILFHNQGQLDFSANRTLQRAIARLPLATPQRVRERDALAIVRRLDWQHDPDAGIDPVSPALLHCSLGAGPWTCFDAPALRPTQSRTVLRAAACADAVLLFLNVAAHSARNVAAGAWRAELLATLLAIATHTAARSFDQFRVVLAVCGFDEVDDAVPPASVDASLAAIAADVAAAVARFRCAPSVISVVPISTITGENVMTRGSGALFGHRPDERPLWDVLTERAQSLFLFKPAAPALPNDKARFFIARIAAIPTSNDRYCLYGRLVSGTLLRRHHSVVLMPHNVEVYVERVMQGGHLIRRDVVTGDCVELVVHATDAAQRLALRLRHYGVSFTPSAAVPPVREFCAEVQVSSGFLKAGASCVVQCGTNRAGCKVVRVASKMKASSSILVRQYSAHQQTMLNEAAPQHVARGESAVVTFVPLGPLVVESYRDSERLSRFTVHTTDKLLCEAVGRVLSVVPWPVDEETGRQLSTDVTTLHLLHSRMMTYVTFKKWVARGYVNWHTSGNLVRSFPELLSPALAAARCADAPLLWPGKLPSELVRAHDVSSAWMFVGVGLFDDESFVICTSAAGAGVPPIPPRKKVASTSTAAAAATSSSSSSSSSSTALVRVSVTDLLGVSDCAGATALSIALIGFRSMLPRILPLWASAEAAASAIVALEIVTTKLRNNEALFVEALDLIKTCVSFSVSLTGVHPGSGLTALQLLLAVANVRDPRAGLRDCVELLLECNAPIDSATGEHPLTSVMTKQLDFEIVDLLRCDVRSKANLGGVARSTPVANLALIVVRGGMLPVLEAQYNWALQAVPQLAQLLVTPGVDGRLLSVSFERALRSSFAVDHVVHVAHENGDTVPIAVGLIRVLHPTFAPYDALARDASQLPKRFSAAEFRVFVEVLMVGRALSLDSLSTLLSGDDRASNMTAKIRINAQLYELAAVYLLGLAPLAPDATEAQVTAFRQQIDAVEDTQRLECYRRVVSMIASPKQDNNDRRLARTMRALLFAVNRPAALAAPTSIGLIGEDLMPDALRRSERLAASLALDPAFSDDDEPVSSQAAAVSRPPATVPTADIVLVSNGRRVNAHRVILALRVPYFASRFGSGFGDADSDEVVLDDLTSEAVRAMLVFCYTGTVRIAADHVLDVLACAHRLNFVELLRYCERLLAQNLDVDNVCDVLPYSVHYSAPVLKAACAVYIATWFAFGADRKQTRSMRDSLAALNDAALTAEIGALADKLTALQKLTRRF